MDATFIGEQTGDGKGGGGCTHASRAQSLQCCLSAHIACSSSEAVKADGLVQVLRNTEAILEHVTQVFCGIFTSLFHCEAK